MNEAEDCLDAETLLDKLIGSMGEVGCKVQVEKIWEFEEEDGMEVAGFISIIGNGRLKPGHHHDVTVSAHRILTTTCFSLYDHI